MKFYLLNISKIMDVKKVTNKEISEYLKVTQHTVGNWLNGKTKLDIDNLILIADFLKVSPVSFFTTPYKSNDNILTLSEKEEHYNSRLNQLQKENELLKSTIKDKEEIINLLKEKK